MIMNYMVENNSSKTTNYNKKINKSKSDTDLFAKIQINESLEKKYSCNDLNTMYLDFNKRNYSPRT